MNATTKAVWKLIARAVAGAYVAYAVFAAGGWIYEACLRNPDLTRRLNTCGTLLMLAALLLVGAVLLLNAIFHGHQLNGPAHTEAGDADDSGHVPAGRCLTEGPGRFAAPSHGGRHS